jgi:hypothetical protein
MQHSTRGMYCTVVIGRFVSLLEHTEPIKGKL